MSKLASSTFVVPGTASLLTGGGGEAWKLAVWQAAASTWTHGFISEPCSVDLTFSMSASRFTQSALHNLLKTTLDGLGRAVFAHCPSGQPGPWSTEDFWICELAARKGVGEASARVEIGPCSGQRRADDIASQFHVAGRPAVWIGSGERAWREAVARAAAAVGPPLLPDFYGFDLAFSVDSERLKTADVDNLCVPAIQGIQAGLLGPYARGQHERLVEIRARKAVAENNDFGLTVSLYETSPLGMRDKD